MEGVRLNFEEGGITFNTTSSVKDKDARIQNSIVNIATIEESDTTYPLKGTELLKPTTKSTLIDLTTSQHAANFAALSTQFFLKTVRGGEDTVDDDITNINLTALEYSNQSVKFNATFRFKDGTETLAETVI